MKNTGELMVPIYGLTLNDQVELGRRMVLFQDKSAREALILNCVAMVKSIASFNTTFCSYDDVFQYGMLGVMEAIDKYDYTKNVKFTSYAFYFIQKRVLSGIREQMPTSISERDFFRVFVVKSTIKAYADEFGTEPSDEDIAKVTGLSCSDIAYFRKHDLSGMCVSFQDYMKNNDIGCIDSDTALLFERATVNSTGRKALCEALPLLTDNERRVIDGRYLSGEQKTTYKVLAGEQGVSISTIRKRENRALRKLYKYFSDNNYKFDDLLWQGGARI